MPAEKYIWRIKILKSFMCNTIEYKLLPNLKGKMVNFNVAMETGNHANGDS
jgi:hypothetical protein